MKTKGVNLITMTLLSLFFVTCVNRNEDFVLKDVSSTNSIANFEDSKVIQELTAFNDSLLEVKGITRGWSTKTWLNIAIADFNGAVAGGRAGAWLGTKAGACLGSPIQGAVFGATLGAISVGAFSSWLAAPDRETKHAEQDFHRGFAYRANLLLTEKVDSDGNVIDPIDGEDDSKKNNIDNDILAKVELTNKQLNIGRLHNVMLSSIERDSC